MSVTFKRGYWRCHCGIKYKTREEAEADGRRLGAAQTLEEAYATQAALAGESAKSSTGVTGKGDGKYFEDRVRVSRT